MQSTDSQRPTVITSGLDFDAAASQFLKSAAHLTDFDFGTGDFSYIKNINTASTGVAIITFSSGWSGTPTDGFGGYTSAGDDKLRCRIRVVDPSDSISDAAITDGATKTIYAQRVSDLNKMYVDGTAQSTTDSDSLSLGTSTANDFYIGTTEDEATFMDGTFSTLIIFSDALKAGEITNANNLNTKYGA